MKILKYRDCNNIWICNLHHLGVANENISHIYFGGKRLVNDEVTPTSFHFGV